MYYLFPFQFAQLIFSVHTQMRQCQLFVCMHNRFALIHVSFRNSTSPCAANEAPGLARLRRMAIRALVSRSV